MASLCRDCGRPLKSSSGPADPGWRRGEAEGGSYHPWVALTLIAILLLCCSSLLGVALLDELIPSHPLQSMIPGSPTATSAEPLATAAAQATATTAPSPSPVSAGDSFEPDDSPARANIIDVDGARQEHTLNPPGDRDFVSIQVQAGVTYAVETGSLGSQCDTTIILYDEEGTELAWDDDGGTEPLASLIGWTAQQDGMAFVEVRQFDEQVRGDDTGYEIWVTEFEPLVVEEDEYEPDDRLEQASEMTLGIPQAHGVHESEDRDWVFFEAEEGTTYVIETSSLQGGMDTVIFLHDEDGDKLAENDDSGTEDMASRIIWLARSSGPVYVAIQDYSGHEVTPEMGYAVLVTQGAPYEADTHEPDDTMEEATALGVGSQQEHGLHVTGDRDWISFEAEAGTEYIVETFNLGDRIDTFMSLYDAQGRLEATDDDTGSEPLASRLVYEAKQDGLFYVMIQDLGDREAGPGTEYSVSVREQGTALLAGDQYEPDDGIDQAAEIRPGESQSHNIHVPGDLDWLSLEVEAGRTYVITTHNLGEETDTILTLYDDNAQELGRDDDSGDEPWASRISWTPERDGTLYLMVRHQKENVAGPDLFYELTVHKVGEGDFGGVPGVYLADGAYHIVTFETYRLVVGTSELLSLRDFALEIEAEQVSGESDNEYGLVFGYQDDDNYYEVAISGDGWVGFFVQLRGRWESISAFRRSDAVRQGNSVNRLRLEADAGLTTLYVNGQVALQEFDTRLGEGLIGVGCGSFGEPGLHCAFDNLRIWDKEGELVWQDEFDDNSGKWYQSTVP